MPSIVLFAMITNLSIYLSWIVTKDLYLTESLPHNFLDPASTRHWDNVLQITESTDGY